MGENRNNINAKGKIRFGIKNIIEQLSVNSAPVVVKEKQLRRKLKTDYKLKYVVWII